MARLRFGALVLACALAAPLSARGADPAGSAAAANLAAITIDNFARVDPNYYRGSQPEGDDYQRLARLGIKTVVDLTSDDAQADERAMVERAGMGYVQIPMTTHTSPTAAQLKQFLGLVNDASRLPVYVHCVGGSHRTGVMTAVYRIANDGWTADRAFNEMKQYKFGPDFLHAEFKRFVYAYHAEPPHEPAVHQAASN